MTQGRTLDNNEGLFAAAHVTDKDLSTLALTGTENGAGWINLKFGRTHLIRNVIVHHRFYINWYRPSDACAQSQADFMRCVDADNNVDISVYQGEELQKSCGTLQLGYGLEQSDQIYTLVCNARGDQVRFAKNTGHMAVFEVAVARSTGMVENKFINCFTYEQVGPEQ